MSDFKEAMASAAEIRTQYVDLETARYGRPRTPVELALGYMKDAADLGGLVMAHQGVNGDLSPDELNAKLDHELGDNFLVLVWLAQVTGRDLEAAFQKTAAELKVRIAQEMPDGRR